MYLLEYGFISFIILQLGDAQFRDESSYIGDHRLRCYTCSTVNGSDIVAGAGVDPGIFVSTIQLDSLAITHRCSDPFEKEDAVRVGVVSTVCEDGLCIKINYTDKATEKIDVLRACLPRARGVFKEICASFASSQAYGSWCVCGYDGCNGAISRRTSIILIFISVIMTVFMRN